jgi:hypothetical protein
MNRPVAPAPIPSPAESLRRTQIAERSFQLWFRVALAENRLRFFGAPASLAQRSRPSSGRGRLLKAYCALDNIRRPTLRLGINASDIEPITPVISMLAAPSAAMITIVDSSPARGSGRRTPIALSRSIHR